MNPRPLENIDAFPAATRPLITQFAQKLLENSGDNILTILVYGSGAGVHYNPAVSNINIAVVVKNLDLSVLDQSHELVRWGRKHKIALPLFLTKEYLLNSLDVFPVEYSEIKEQHRIIYGEDVFRNLDIPLKDVRLLCEQQVKGKLLHLRQAYLGAGGDLPVLKDLLTSVLTDLIPVFRRLIILKGQKPLEPKEGMLGQLAGIFHLDSQPLLAVYHDKNKKILIPLREVKAHLESFLAQLEHLSRHMDSL